MNSELFNGPRPTNIKILFVDFDGTIKPAGGDVSQADIEAMRELGRRGIIRVVATGRSLFSFTRDFPNGFELDYLLFSSGLGLCAWPDGPGPLLYSRSFTEEESKRALKACLEIKRGFYAFEPPPNCHRHLYYDPEGFPKTEGYVRRLISYADFATPYLPNQDIGTRSEFLIAAPLAEMPKVKEQFESLCPGLSLLYSSSPFGDASMWLEIIPPGVNKGLTAKFLTESLSFSAENALALGNDFNDLELLNWAGLGLVTSNGPDNLKRLFPLAPAVTEKPLAWLLTNFF
ncbi:MAG: Cof-type HAD-IIB family hydrolase [Deltaproteobacteria bacterium]|jgi:hydroxymethylpyrimidine pyrophosphatase-like HAD family hydrolase|nr:Cof-type HAD-IIB family hydrolase [Deltaproteobacteria bacterium]